MDKGTFLVLSVLAAWAIVLLVLFVMGLALQGTLMLNPFKIIAIILGTLVLVYAKP